ncbi:glucuronoxylan glucuronosyltransferase IRX7 [Spatholobus suberectus]|nr:glucuronoxylan glucuronosyltransferase IRX7 [Spatholobus suberectus]
MFDPYKADFFFVPVYVSCNFSTINGFLTIGHSCFLISFAVDLVSTEYPFWNNSRGSDHVFVASHDFSAYFPTLASWSPRLVESVALGCVLIVIVNGICLPFPSTVCWSEISLTVPENDIRKVLECVAAMNLSAIQRNLWYSRIGRALLFNNQVLEDDATWQVVVGLSEKMGRSYRRSLVAGQLEKDM